MKSGDSLLFVQRMVEIGLAREVFQSVQKHLAANEVDLRKTPMKLGPWITLDLDTEAITHCDGKDQGADLAEANRLAAGSYRPPFVL